MWVAQGYTQALWGQITWGCRVLLCSLQLCDLGQVTPPLWASASLLAKDGARSTHACGLGKVQCDNPGNMPSVMANRSPWDLPLLPPQRQGLGRGVLRLSTAVLSTARSDPEAPEGPSPAAPPRRAGSLRRHPGSLARGGLAEALPSGPEPRPRAPRRASEPHTPGSPRLAPGGQPPPAAQASRTRSAPLTAFFMVAAILGLNYGARRGGPQGRAPAPGRLSLPVGPDLPPNTTLSPYSFLLHLRPVILNVRESGRKQILEGLGTCQLKAQATPCGPTESGGCGERPQGPTAGSRGRPAQRGGVGGGATRGRKGSSLPSTPQTL